MKTLLLSICLLCLIGCASTSPQATTNGFGTELVRAERNGITVDVYFKGKDDSKPVPVYHFSQHAGMFGLIGEPNLHIGVVASDQATSASTTIIKGKRALTSMTGMVVGAVGGGIGGGLPGATMGAAAGSLAGKAADNSMPE